MENQANLKQIVRDKYGKIASDSVCCCCGCNPEPDYSIFSESYEQVEGYVDDADMNLGCGLPTEFANINSGDHVLDLGSGAGNDCFVARALVGDSGKVTGLDFTDEMLQKAVANNVRLGYNNVGFVRGDIEDMPIPTDSQNVIISNCVLNLVPDKVKAFSEIFRVLKSGGHFCISDVVLQGHLPPALQNAAEMYAGCVSGALQQDEYLSVIRHAGFTSIEIKKQKRIDIPDDILLKYMTPVELEGFKLSKTGIFSITVTADKPVKNQTV
nr:arsenite methyltransferase [Bacteroidota bacterium]